MNRFYFVSLLVACLVEIAGGWICPTGEQYLSFCLGVIVAWIVILICFWRPK